MSLAHLPSDFTTHSASKHDVWDHFSPDVRRRLQDDDLVAGKSVSTVLASIVVMGTLLMVGTVAYILIFQR